MQYTLECMVIFDYRDSDDSPQVILPTLVKSISCLQYSSNKKGKIITGIIIKHISQEFLEINMKTELDFDTISMEESLSKLYSMTQIRSPFPNTLNTRKEKLV